MNRILFLESVSGVAGDMFAAAFVDAGLVTAGELAQIPAQLGFTDVRIETKAMAKATITATHLRVVTAATANRHPLGHSHGGPSHAHDHGGGSHSHSHEDQHLVHDAPAHHEHTHYVDIDKRIRDSQVEAPVRELARKIFRLLAEAEAAAHGYKVADVAFHEIGSIDSIVDVVMAAYCVTKVGPVRFVASPIRPGRGVVNIAHGSQPIPPPASARLLAGLPVAPTPHGIKRENVELSTPTGIAILKALAPEFATELPAGAVKAVGMGAGTMDLGTFPNVFRLFLLEATTTPVALPYESDRIVEICCNIDDDTGEHLGWMSEQLLAQGALDVTLTPATGKKSRPMVLLSVLAPEDRWSQVADWLLRQSTTFGLRYQTWSRLKLARKFEPRTTDGRTVNYKIGLTTDGKVLKEKPEFDETK